MFNKRFVFFAGEPNSPSALPEVKPAPVETKEAPAAKVDYSKDVERYATNKEELQKLKKQIDYIISQPEIQKSVQFNALQAIDDDITQYLNGEISEVNKDLIGRFLELTDTVIPMEIVYSSIDASYEPTPGNKSNMAAPGVETAAAGTPGGAAEQKEAPKGRLTDVELQASRDRMESEITYLTDYYTQKGDKGKVDQLLQLGMQIAEDKQAGRATEKYAAEVAKLRPAEAEYAANFEKYYQDYLAYLNNPNKAPAAYAVPGIDAEKGNAAAEQKEAPKGRLTDVELQASRDRMESEITYLTDYYTQKGDKGKVDQLLQLGMQIAEDKQAGRATEKYAAEVAKLRPAEAEYAANFEKYYQDYLAYLNNPNKAPAAYAVPGIDAEKK